MTKEITGRITKVVQDDVLHGDHGYVETENQFGLKSFIIEDMGERKYSNFELFEKDLEDAYQHNDKEPVHITISFSHLHKDHTDGLKTFLEKYEHDNRLIIDGVFLPELMQNTEQYYKFLKLSKNKQISLLQEGTNKKAVIKTLAYCQLYAGKEINKKSLNQQTEELMKYYNINKGPYKQYIYEKDVLVEIDKILDDIKKEIIKDEENQIKKDLLTNDEKKIFYKTLNNKQINEEKKNEIRNLLANDKIAQKKLEGLTDKEGNEIEKQINDVLSTMHLLNEKTIKTKLVSKAKLDEYYIYGVKIEKIPFDKDSFRDKISKLCVPDKDDLHPLRTKLYLDYAKKELEKDEKGKILDTEENRKIMAGKQWDYYVNYALKVFNDNQVKKENKHTRTQLDNADNYLAQVLISYAYTSGENMNNIITKISDRDFSATFMGDCEMLHEFMIIENMIDITADYVKTGHHGAWTSNNIMLLEYLKKIAIEQDKYPYLSISGSKKDDRDYSSREYSLQNKADIEKLLLGKTCEMPISFFRENGQTKIIDHDVIEFHTNEMKRLNKEASDRSKTPTERLELLDKANEHLEKIEKGEPMEEYISRKFNCSLEKNEEKTYFQKR